MSARCLEQVTAWVLAQPELVPLPTPATDTSEQAGWEQRWTSQRLLTLEMDIVEALNDTRRHTHGGDTGRDGRSQRRHVLSADEVIAGFAMLGPDQADAVRKICTNGRPVEVIVGRAGTGKTFTMAAIRAYLQDACGHRMIGVAPSARAARELADGAGFAAYTFPRFQMHVANEVTANDVIVIDEAGMAGTVDLHRVDHPRPPRRCPHHPRRRPPPTPRSERRRRIRRRRRGPRRPMPPSSPSTAARAPSGSRKRLTSYVTAHALEGFRTYQDHGHVTVAATPIEVHTAAVDAWSNAHEAGVDGILLAGTRSEAGALNRIARTRVASELSGPVLEVHGRALPGR